ncbi:hypothetical protein LSH36_866g00012 [Paralvinella palmiformis]|uniref:Uncharacterized protein n=1 Tax=Paralvinella palmiformis TaxID=53620 RepID=A0AAD9IYU3_9ANNE|nr:hypothetical protein LSH36_866g00012 [Paralvinella palmiformis]
MPLTWQRSLLEQHPMPKRCASDIETFVMFGLSVPLSSIQYPVREADSQREDRIYGEDALGVKASILELLAKFKCWALELKAKMSSTDFADSVTKQPFEDNVMAKKNTH